jgi:hypothetical protein
MRAWRKIHSGIVASEKVARLSDSAKWLFTLLIVAQDDEGKYPWGATKIRALTVTTTWERVAAESLARELCDAGLAEMREGFIWVIGGTDKNGTPHNSAKHPMIYERLPEPYDESDASRERVASDSRAGESRVEKSRVEESRVEAAPQASPPPRGGKQEEWEPPEFFRGLVGLPGYKKVNHQTAAENILASSSAAGVSPEEVVKTFALYYIDHRAQHRWRNPVKALDGTLDIQISKVLNGKKPARDSRTRAEARSNPDDFRGPEW